MKRLCSIYWFNLFTKSDIVLKDWDGEFLWTLFFKSGEFYLVSTKIHQKCPRKFTHFVNENLPFMSQKT